MSSQETDRSQGQNSGNEPDFEKTLDKSVLAEELVSESAKELTAVNKILHNELRSEQRAPAVQVALDKSQVVEDKVKEASAHLSTVNNVLAAELAGRSELEQKLATSRADEEFARAAALHDALTGLPNRILFEDRLTHALALAARNGSMMAIIFVDLNKFKRVNDTYGHGAGDAVLRMVAGRLLSSTRDVDTVSRHGGDEFLLILSDLRSKDDLLRIGRSILVAIAEPFDLVAFGATASVVVTASAGVAISPQDGIDGTQLIEAADRAMFAAKNSNEGLSFVS